MRLVPVAQSLGQRLARDVRDRAGRVLLARGVVIDGRMAHSLRTRGYRTVYVINELAPDILIDEPIEEATRVLAERTVRDTLHRAAEGRPLDGHSLTEAVEAIIHDLHDNADIVFSLATLHSVDDHTFVHCVNVCVYCLVMSRGLGLERTELRKLGAGAILHDIGKVRYRELVNRRGPLTPEEFEQVKQHTTDGYEMLRRMPAIDLLSAHVALQHHERQDGSGYPRGLAGGQILPFARMAAIADVYDAMTCDRPYRSACPPHEAMAAVLSMGGRLLDADLVRHFSRRLAIYPNGTILMLEDGRVGIVSGQGERPGRPRLRVVADEGLNLVPPYEVQAGTADQASQIRAVLPDFPSAIRKQLAGRAAG